jgi:hypothetical protein
MKLINSIEPSTASAGSARTANKVVDCGKAASDALQNCADEGKRALLETRHGILTKLSLRLDKENCFRHLK